VQGLLENALWIGDELHLPDAVLRVTAPREPCFKFNARMGLPDAGRRMMQALNPGFYLAVVRPGSIRAGDPVELRPGPRGLRVDEAFAARRLKHLRE
jgi:MOSC domain-containing protein YiiM